MQIAAKYPPSAPRRLSAVNQRLSEVHFASAVSFISSLPLCRRRGRGRG